MKKTFRDLRKGDSIWIVTPRDIKRSEIQSIYPIPENQFLVRHISGEFRVSGNSMNSWYIYFSVSQSEVTSVYTNKEGLKKRLENSNKDLMRAIKKYKDSKYSYMERILINLDMLDKLENV